MACLQHLVRFVAGSWHTMHEAVAPMAEAARHDAQSALPSVANHCLQMHSFMENANFKTF